MGDCTFTRGGGACDPNANAGAADAGSPDSGATDTPPPDIGEKCGVIKLADGTDYEQRCWDEGSCCSNGICVHGTEDTACGDEGGKCQDCTSYGDYVCGTLSVYNSKRPTCCGGKGAQLTETLGGQIYAVCMIAKSGDFPTYSDADTTCCSGKAHCDGEHEYFYTCD
jgi:hypothetical protein